MTEPSTPLERDTHPLLALNSQRSIISSISRFGSSQMQTTRVSLFLSFLLGFRRPNLITGLSGWRTPDWPLRTQEPVPDRRTGALPSFSLLRVFFFSFFFFKKTSVVVLKLWEVEDFADLGTTLPKRSYHHSGLSPMRPNEIWTCPDEGTARAQAPGCQRSSCGSVRRGKGENQCMV